MTESKKLLRPHVCPICRGESRARWKLVQVLLWLSIVAVSFIILLTWVGIAVIAGIAKYGPTWPM